MENIINNEELFGKSALDEMTNENLPALIEDDPEKRLRSFLSSPFISASLPLKDVNKIFLLVLQVQPTKCHLVNMGDFCSPF